MFFINQGSQIMELVSAVMSSISAISSGSVGGAAEMIEQALARAIPVAISFFGVSLDSGIFKEL